MAKLKLILLFIISIITLSSKAASITYECSRTKCQIVNNVKTIAFDLEQNKIFFDYAADPLRKLLDNGLTQINGLNIANLISELSRVQFHFISSGYVAPQGRFDGFKYLVETRSVFLSTEAIRNLNKPPLLFHTLILLHESLGALGYVDEDYQISATLFALSRLTKQELASLSNNLSQLQIDSLEKRNQSPSGSVREHAPENVKYMLARGGSTEVGGGGDPQAAWFKANVLHQLLKTDFLQNNNYVLMNYMINNLSIETIIGPFEAIQYKIDMIKSWPLSYEDFNKSIAVFQKEKKITLVVGLYKFDNYVREDIAEHFIKKVKEIQQADLAK